MVRLIFVLCCCLMLTGLYAAPVRGNWKCVALDPAHLALTGDYSELQDQLFKERYTARRKAAKGKLTGWKADLCFNLSGTEAIAAYRPQVTAMLLKNPAVKLVSQSSVPLSVTGTGYWLNPIGQSRFPDENGKLRFSQNSDAAHYLFLTLNRPLAEGEKITITLPAGETLDYTWRQDQPSPLFKINQIGYLPKAPKYAYIGAWLGTAGPLPLHKALNGKPFHLVDAATGKNVFSGTVNARMPDPVNAKGTPFTGEEVLDMDFSAFTVPGKYYLTIPGTGSSEVFRIGDDTMAEAFYIHARGLYHQRCGIAKEKPFTAWIQKPCHMTCVAGSFPPDVSHYGKGTNQRPFGFTDQAGKSVKVNHFQLIQRNVPTLTKIFQVSGGWHDAADWDRRPQHMGITGDLAAVYLLKPNNFCDGQLNLPESGNGIPDILDEAKWGLEHLRLRQQPDGGVGTWIETTRHPKPDEGMASDDQLTYYVSCATRNGTLEYAAYAAELALAMRKAGVQKEMEQFRESARKAWDYAVRSPVPKPRFFHMGKTTLFYREEPELAPEFLLKASLDLYLLTGAAEYLKAAENTVQRAINSMKKNSWRWSPLFWIELEIFPYESFELDKLRLVRRRALTAVADIMLRQQENNYPVRIPWYGPKDGWVHTMGWGTFHPLVRARTLIAAHALTGRQEYLDGALLANDFHNGANPSGSTMTSGLGRVYPVRFLDLNSYADGIAEQIPGITPYRNAYGIPRDAVKMAFGLYYPKNTGQKFPGLSLSLIPEPGLSENDCAKAVAKLLPIWHRWCNVDSKTVAVSEFTVWETIGPCAAVTGYLLNGASKPEKRWIDRQPAADIRQLPGYDPLP